jgi:thiopurine S-methyltransferase
MEHSFWAQRWEEGQIGFHKDLAHPHLRSQEQRLAPGQRILVPLCGKSLDLRWLAERGLEVHGVEFVPKAIAEFWKEAGLQPEVEGDHSRAGDLHLWRSDILLIGEDQLGRFDWIWDRGALVALDPAMRPAYAAHLGSLLQPRGAILLSALSYDPAAMSGPPWPITPDQLHVLYPEMHLELLAEGTDDINPRLPEAARSSWREHLSLLCRR